MTFYHRHCYYQAAIYWGYHGTVIHSETIVNALNYVMYLASNTKKLVGKDHQ